MAFRLSELFIEFTAQGIGALNAALVTVKASLDQMDKGSRAVASGLTSAFGGAASYLQGFIRAGIQSTTVALQISFLMGKIAREIASLFIPAIQQVIAALQSVLGWFRSLSGEQQDQIGKWLMAGLAALSVAKIMPLVIAGISGAVGAIRALTGAVVGLLSGSGIGALLPLLGGLVTAFAAIAVGTEVGRGGLARLWQTMQPLVQGLGKAFGEIMASLEPLFDTVTELLGPVMELIVSFVQIMVEIAKPLISIFTAIAKVIVAVLLPPIKALAEVFRVIAESIAFITGRTFDVKVPKGTTGDSQRSHHSLAMAGGGIESVEAAYNRLAQASVKAGFAKSTPEKHLEVAEQQLKEQRETNEKLGNLKPAFK